MAAVLFGFEDLLYSWDSLVWSLTCRALRSCRVGNVRLLQLMLKPWCISRDLYQVGEQTPGQTPKPQGCRGETPWESHRVLSCSCQPLCILHKWWDRGDAVGRGGVAEEMFWFGGW